MNIKALKKITVFCALLSLCLFGSSAEGAKLHTILVCDTIADNIGPSVEADYSNIRAETHRIAKYASLELNERLFTGSDVNNQAMQYLANLEVDADDVVLFYFSGHGYRTDSTAPNATRWPYLFFTPANKGVNFDEVAARLIEKKSRLTLAISDCCNNIIPEPYAPITLPIPAAEPRAKRIEQNYRYLFRETSGYYITTSASPGEFSWGTIYGGMYTNAFLKSLKVAMISRNTPDWVAIFDRASFTVINSKEIENQTPQYFYRN